MQRLPIVILNEYILWYKDTVLRRACRPIDVQSSEELALAQTLIREMFRTLFTDPSSAALAAPQVGFLLQVAVFNFYDTDIQEKRLLTLINPKVTVLTEETSEDNEICLSIPNFSGKVSRATKIDVEAYDQFGKKVKFIADDYFARVILHELDHLNGVVFIDKIKGNLNSVPDYPERQLKPTLKKLGLTDKR